MGLDSRTILYMVAKEFGLKRSTTEDRLKLQKIIYLLQANGLQLGYGFSWYKYGPYSQDLVYDAYRVLGVERDKYEATTGSMRFSENSREKFERFRNICRNILEDAEKLELVASVDFVRRTWYPEAKKIEFISWFKQHKKRLFNGQVITANMISKAVGVCSKLR